MDNTEKQIALPNVADKTYGGAFKTNGQAIGIVTYCATRLGFKTLSKETKMIDLTKAFGRDKVRAEKRNFALAKANRSIHSRQIAAVIVSDANFAIDAREAWSYKKQADGSRKAVKQTGYNFRARFHSPTAKRVTKDARIAQLEAQLQAAGIVA